jgi:hypothetical protein
VTLRGARRPPGRGPTARAQALVALGAALAALAGPAAAAERLPDLEQEVPRDLGVRAVRGDAGVIHLLGFRSAVRNVGDGPLIVHGARRNRAEPLMRARQVVRLTGGGSVELGGAGRLRYVTSPDHAHWHLSPFQRYRLVREGDGAEVARDRKSGFCLGDRYPAEASLPAAPPREVFRSRCGLGAPRLLGLRQGISVGYGDDYASYLEGQSLRLTGLPAGRYALVHRVNENGLLRESRGDNNAASVLLTLSWRAGRPSVAVVRRCPGSERCEAPRG